MTIVISGNLIPLHIIIDRIMGHSNASSCFRVGNGMEIYCKGVLLRLF